MALKLACRQSLSRFAQGQGGRGPRLAARARLFPVGIFQVLYHKRFIRGMRVLILGVLEEYRASGAAAVLYAALFRNAIRKGYEGGECSWILEDNVLMNRSLEAMGARRYKTYRICERETED